jgi:hypothetical protein
MPTLLQEYVQAFEPLLLEETAAQLRRGQEEGQLSEPQEGLITQVSLVCWAGQLGRSVLVATVAGELTISTACMQSNTRSDGMTGCIVTFTAGVSTRFAENDVFLLSRERAEVRLRCCRCCRCEIAREWTSPTTEEGSFLHAAQPWRKPGVG